MKKPLLRIIAALATALVPMLVSSLLLDAGIGTLVLVLYAVSSVALSWGRTVVSRRLALVFLLAQGILYAIGMLVIIVSLNLTPASAYLAWFRIAQDGEASGMLSFMFTVKICFFSTFLGATIIRHGFFRPVAATISITIIVLYAVYQAPVMGYIAIAILAAAVIALALRGPAKYLRRNVGILIFLGLVTVGGAIPLSRIEPRQTNPMVDSLDNSALSRAVVKVYPNFPFLYNMPGYGHQLGNRKIGERPSLTARPVFQVTGTPGQTEYLRTAVFEIYTGSGWAYNENRMAEAEFAYGMMFKTSKDVAFEDSLQVDLLIDFFSSVPHTVDTGAILVDNGHVPELAYGSKDVGFLFQIPVVKGTSFLIGREPQDRVDEHPGDSNLQLPVNIPTDAMTLARQLAVPDDPIATAEKIRDYLTYNFYYTLEPSQVQRFDDPAWEFLLATGEGYCVHFATSFVLLARMNNIPARYVTGFLVNIPYDSNTATVTGFSSHAWAEIWVPGQGWVVQEATPPMSPEFFDDPYFYEMYNPFESRYTALQLESIMGDRVSTQAVQDGDGLGISVDAAPIVLAAIIVALLAGMYYLTFHSIYTFGTPKRKIRIISRKMIRKGSGDGIPGPARSGWVNWSREINTMYPAESKNLGQSVRIMQADFFGGRTSGKREVKFIRDTYRRIFGRAVGSRK